MQHAPELDQPGGGRQPKLRIHAFRKNYREYCDIEFDGIRRTHVSKELHLIFVVGCFNVKDTRVFSIDGHGGGRSHGTPVFETDL